MHLVDQYATKGKNYYFHFKVFFHITITLDDLRSIFPRGQKYANVCENPAINLNVKVAPKHKFENLPRDLPP